MSKADSIFIENCTDILGSGARSSDKIRPRWDDGSPATTIKKFGIVNRYNLAEEFPALTLRPTNFAAAIDEMLWIWQKKSNNVADLNSKIWDAWADESGSIGKAYGYQLRKRHRYAEGEFDQVDRLLFDLQNNPESRRMITNMYNHDELHAMHLYPCAYMMTFNVTYGGGADSGAGAEAKKGRLNAILNQRSQDMLVANNWNVVQYAALIHLLARASGLEAGELVHVIADAHIYDRHVDLTRELISRPTHPAPRFELNPAVTDFYSATAADFTLLDYVHGDKIIGIPVAV
ncbi:MAG: thymidylate synthase [Clostridiales bacterium]|jgi:thymidylate synthase|nr:thymidylate synthase [Clostridiales bacterium]